MCDVSCTGPGGEEFLDCPEVSSQHAAPHLLGSAAQKGTVTVKMWYGSFCLQRSPVVCKVLKHLHGSFDLNDVLSSATYSSNTFGATYTLWVQQRRLMPLLLKYISEGHLFLLQIPSLIMTHCYRIDSYRSYIHLHCETEFKPISKIIVILLLFLSFKWWRLCTLTWIMPNNTPLTNIKAVSVIFSADLLGPHI